MAIGSINPNAAYAAYKGLIEGTKGDVYVYPEFETRQFLILKIFNDDELIFIRNSDRNIWCGDAFMCIEDQKLLPAGQNGKLAEVSVLGLGVNEVPIPVEWLKILETRQAKRIEKLLKKDAIAIMGDSGFRLFFSFEGDKLQVHSQKINEKGEPIGQAIHRTAVFSKFEILENKPCVKCAGLGITKHDYVQLPMAVVQIFQEKIRENNLKSVYLKKVFTSQVNGQTYYKFSHDITGTPIYEFLEDRFTTVNSEFVTSERDYIYNFYPYMKFNELKAKGGN